MPPQRQWAWFASLALVTTASAITFEKWWGKQRARRGASMILFIVAAILLVANIVYLVLTDVADMRAIQAGAERWIELRHLPYITSVIGLVVVMLFVSS